MLTTIMKVEKSRIEVPSSFKLARRVGEKQQIFVKKE